MKNYSNFARYLRLTPILLTLTLFHPIHAVALDRSVTLDSRLGVAHVGTSYPDRHTIGDFMSWGATKAYRLGYDSVEIFIPSNMCFGNNSTTEYYGPYQAKNIFCEPAPSIWTKAKSLTEFALQPEVIKTFAIPLKRFFLTAYPLNTEFRSARRKEVTGIPYTQTELDSLKTEYYDFTKYLLQTYKDDPKTFNVMPMVTMDRWLSGRDFEKDENPGVCTETDSAPPERIANIVAYYSTISSAMQQARLDAGASQSKVYLTCEVNSVLCSMKNPSIKSAINSVVPHAGCDLVSYAAYELLAESWKNHRTDSNYIKSVYDYMASQTPDHPDFKDKNVVISEVGTREQQGTPESTDWFVNTFLSTALNWGMPYVQIWALGFCWKFNPPVSEQGDPSVCPGWWMYKPDGTLTNVYRSIRSKFEVNPPTSTPTPSTTPSPSPSPSPKPGDLNGDGSVNLLDFNQLISLFGNPYTLLDFNAIISNYGS